MTPPELTRLAREIKLDDDAQFDLRIRFGIACIERVEHLLTEPGVIDALRVGKGYIAGDKTRGELDAAAKTAAAAARSHSGSNSIDGAGSGAVTTSYGVAWALAGRALQAAEYAAYASVYNYSSSAVTDPSAFREEHERQIRLLTELSRTAAPRRD